jgi:2-hydroxychromene-2-carboxylate isomerase
MYVEFWFDPSCPFCWLTSRWISRVRPHRGLEIEWKPISLLLKNDPAPDHPNFRKFTRGRELLRVVEAVRDAGHADRIGDLYRELGRAIHHHDELDVDAAAVLRELGLDPELAGAAGDERWDAPIRASMDDILGVTGPEVGAPLIAIDGRTGRVGAFGPVITQLPELDVALELWDSYLVMVDGPGFFELKRARTRGPVMPDESVLDEDP